MAVATKIVALSELLDGGFSESSVRKAFSRFSCERDPDVSLFLKAHAIQNEATGASRTYRRQDYEPLYYDEGRDLHKLLKPLF